MQVNLTFVDPEGSACTAEVDFGVQLEEWEASEDRQDAPSISVTEDSLFFESKSLFS